MSLVNQRSINQEACYSVQSERYSVKTKTIKIKKHAVQRIGRRLVMFSCLLAGVQLAGCGGEDTQRIVSEGEVSPDRTFSSESFHALHASGEIPPEIIFVSPFAGEQSVPAGARILVKFSQMMSADTLAQFTLVEVSQAAKVPGEVALAESDASILTFIPDAPLKPGAQYRIELGELTSIKDLPLNQAPAVSFVTEPASPLPGDDFAVASAFPGAQFPTADFASVRLAFSQALDASTVIYGESVALIQNGDVVPADLHVKENRLTLDPQGDLNPQHPLTVRVDASVANQFGKTLGVEYRRVYDVVNTQPRASLALQLLAPNAHGSGVSALSGEAINSIALRSRLIGSQYQVAQQGNLTASLAYVADHPEVTPMVVRAGSKIAASGIELFIDDKIHTARSSGDLTITVLNDATGYMIPNPVNADRFAPRNVVLFLDVAMHSTDPVINSALNQRIFHIKAHGLVQVEEGILKIDAVSNFSLDVLGLDRAYGYLTFHLQSPEDTGQQIAPAVDNILPQVHSAMPQSEQVMRERQPRMVVNFSEPLAPASLIAERIRLIDADGQEQPVRFGADGAKLSVEPLGELNWGGHYQLHVHSLTDVAGNVMPDAFELPFSIMPYVPDETVAPVINFSYPGYACAVAPESMALADNQVGQCAGGQLGMQGDDILPLTNIAANRAVRMGFSQPMAIESFVLASSCEGQGTVRVERINVQGACEAAVPGQLMMTPYTLKFEPNTPWQMDALYRIVLQSDAVGADCGIDAVCNLSGLPLDTDILDFTTDKVIWQSDALNANSTFIQIPGDTAEDAIGGIDFIMPFKGAASTRDILTLAQLTPWADYNANGKIDDHEPTPTVNRVTPIIGEIPERISLSDEAGLDATNAIYSEGTVVGCTGDEPVTCDQEKLGNSFLSGTLSAEIGQYDPALQGIRVSLRPQMLYGTEKKLNAVITEALQLKMAVRSGPLVMRMRYGDDGALPQALITSGGIDESGAPLPPVMSASLDLYMDAPKLHILGGLANANLNSRQITLNVSGPLTFLPDGRMTVTLSNQTAARIDVLIEGSLAGDVFYGQVPIVLPVGSVQMRGVIEAPF